MKLEQDLERIARQEQRLQFDSFNADSAWRIGARLRELAVNRRLAVVIDIQLCGQPLFFAALPGTTPDNLDWVRRKRNTVLRYHRSSYGFGLKLQQQQKTIVDKLGPEAQNYAAHGGCFPILLKGTGCVGTITVSGLPQRADHDLVVEVLAEVLAQPLAELALDPVPNGTT